MLSKKLSMAAQGSSWAPCGPPKGSPRASLTSPRIPLESLWRPGVSRMAPQVAKKLGACCNQIMCFLVVFTVQIASGGVGPACSVFALCLQTPLRNHTVLGGLHRARQGPPIGSWRVPQGHPKVPKAPPVSPSDSPRPRNICFYYGNTTFCVKV